MAEKQKEMPNLKCPLCEAQTLEYVQIKGRTHAWSCQECPAVLMEFYLDHNSKDVHEHLTGVELKNE